MEAGAERAAPSNTVMALEGPVQQGTAPQGTARHGDASALSTPGERGLLRFELALDPPHPAVGELFRVVTTIHDARTGELLEDAEYTLDATMPAHGHGMMTRPLHGPLGDGRYLSEGMKLHMPGLWHLRVRAKEQGAGAGRREDSATLIYEQPVAGG